MGFQSAPEGLFGYWMGGVGRFGLRGLLFWLKWRPGRGLQTRLARVVAAFRAHTGLACGSTAARKVNDDAENGESLMSCQHCISLARPESGLDGSKAGRG